MKRLTALWSVIVLLAAASSAAGQAYQGGVRGQVKDQNGRIAGAEVSLTNEETNFTRSTTTNEVGDYVFTNVLPATYSLKVTISGHRTVERTGLQVGTQQFITADFTLEVGATADVTTAKAEAQRIDRSNPAVAASLDSKELQSLPQFGRNVSYQAISTPNVIQSGDPQFVRYQDQTNSSLISLGGGPRRGNGYLLEGVPITDFTNRPTIVPSMEAIADLRVQVKTYDADMGHSAGGTFNASAKSGANVWHGSAVLINKPEWGTTRLYFTEKAGLPKPPQYFWDWGGSLGGPVFKDRTFFFFSTEGYQQQSTRNATLNFPTQAMRNGDFSGRSQIIYDPLTTRANPNVPGQFIRDPFPNNVIPANRIDPVAAAVLKTMPIPTSGTSFNGIATLIDGPQNQQTVKIDQRWTSKWTTTGMYAHQHTREPGSSYFGESFTVPGDPGSSLLLRTIYFASVNNIFVLSDATVATVRYGYNRFNDYSSYPAFDAKTLGLPASYVNSLAANTFPSMLISGYGGATTMGNNGPNSNIHESQVANATISKLVGHHTLKFGGEFRRIKLDNITYGPSAGTFSFTSAFTQGPNPNTASATAGDAFASFLLGYPVSGSVQVATPNLYYVDYRAGYAQDDVRLNEKLTLNFGVRYEFESGLQEKNNRLVVGFDPNATFPVQVPGLNLRGGLMYAGQNGYPTYQGNPNKNQIAPRGGFAWSLGNSTAIRGGWGFFWAPTQYPATTEAALGARGYSAATTFLASIDNNLTPAGQLSNPFPNSITQPQGNSLGLLTGAGGVVDFPDQNARTGYVQQYSIDLRRELPGGNVVSVGYLGSRSERMSMGGTADATVNINQLDPKYLSLGTQLQASVANPFFGNPVFGNLSRSATIAYGWLLRPFPQFDNVLAHRVNSATARYNAAVLRWDKRMERGWSATANYTYSRLMENQFGESNFYASRIGQALDNYDLQREYSVSLLDVPHRLNFSATYELPFGQGHRRLASGVAGTLLGGWAVTVSGRYQNGFPVNISQSSNNSGLFGSTQRPNVVPGVSPVSSGNATDNYNAAGNYVVWLNPAAWSAAPAFTFGNAPRTDPNVRTPGQASTDLNIRKAQRVGRTTLTFRIDLLNLFDDPLFIGPLSTFGVTSFGQVNTLGGFARSLQFHIRVGW